MNYFVCWTIDCESCRKEINDTILGRRAINGYCDILEEAGWRGTLFLTPEEIGYMPELLMEKFEKGHEIGLHLHPDEGGYPNGYMGTYSMELQIEIMEKALGTFEKVLGIRPLSIRTGFGSANDSTFPAMKKVGLKYSSTSFPGRKLTSVASNWAGASLFPHYANPYNRMLEGGLDIVELPISVDWETMVWSGLHPQDLRVEFTDVKNHSYLIRKIMKRQMDENLPIKTLIPFTHNIFDYSDPLNFRRETMIGMIREIKEFGGILGLKLLGTTIKEAAAAYSSSFLLA